MDVDRSSLLALAALTTRLRAADTAKTKRLEAAERGVRDALAVLYARRRELRDALEASHG